MWSQCVKNRRFQLEVVVSENNFLPKINLDGKHSSLTDAGANMEAEQLHQKQPGAKEGSGSSSSAIKYTAQEMAMYERIRADVDAQMKRMKAEERRRQKAALSGSSGSLNSGGKARKQPAKRKVHIFATLPDHCIFQARVSAAEKAFDKHDLAHIMALHDKMFAGREREEEDEEEDSSSDPDTNFALGNDEEEYKRSKQERKCRVRTID